MFDRSTKCFGTTGTGWIASPGRPTTTLGISSAVRIVLVGLVALLATSCSSGAELPSEVSAQLDVPANTIVMLSGTMSEEVPRFEILQAIARADGVGVDLRVVVAGDEDDLVNAKDVADAYGGTVLSYRSGDVAFQAASDDIDDAQLDRAVRVAGNESGMGGSALAFVGVLEDEGVQTKAASWVTRLLVVALILGVAFALFQMRNYLRARKRATRRHKEFTDRRAVLLDWAVRLEPDVEAATSQATRLDADGARLLAEVGEALARIRIAVDNATTIGELDANEIRIARAAIKLRAVRQQLR